MTWRRRSSKEYEYVITRDLLGSLSGYRWQLAERSEAPDVVYHGDETIGIEVTRIYPGGRERVEAEGIQDRILDQSIAEYRRLSGPPVEVIISWAEQPRRGSLSKTRLPREIAAFVAERVPDVGGDRSFSLLIDPSTSLPSGIDEIRILRPGGPYGFSDGNHWWASRSGFPAEVSQDLVQEALDLKEPFVQQWKVRFEKVWLIVGFGRLGRASWGTLPPDRATWQFTSSANRAFLIGMPNELVELPLCLPRNA